ncbi:hypothetical protein AMTRI_Chr10g2450 [Amborella trichopoda]
MITTCNQSIPCCGPLLLLPFFHPRPSLFLHPVPKICNQPSFQPPVVGPQLCSPSLNLYHHFLSFTNQNAELHFLRERERERWCFLRERETTL